VQAANDRLRGKSGGQKQQKQQEQQQHQGGNKGASDEAVVVLTDSNFDELVLGSKDLWIVEFYAPWCGHCKRLEPEWNEAASQLLGQVKLGKVDATVEGALAQRFQVQGYPTIKLFPPGDKRDSSAENYEGGRDASSIVAYALQKADQFKLPAQIVQLLGTDQYEQYCVKHRGICLISFLPHILDSSADERNGILDVLREVSPPVNYNVNRLPSPIEATPLPSFGLKEVTTTRQKRFLLWDLDIPPWSLLVPIRASLPL
jgi:protein disulfide-isomerase A6